MRFILSFFALSMSGSSGFIPSLPSKAFDLKLDQSPSQADLDNYSNQMNPNNDEYWDYRGDDDDQDDLDNHANQMNPNNDAYYDDDNHANQMNPNASWRLDDNSNNNDIVLER